MMKKEMARFGSRDRIFVYYVFKLCEIYPRVVVSMRKRSNSTTQLDLVHACLVRDLSLKSDKSKDWASSCPLAHRKGSVILSENWTHLSPLNTAATQTFAMKVLFCY